MTAAFVAFDEPAVQSTGAPHFEQNFDPETSAVPHPVQKIDRGAVCGSDRRAPQVVQKNWVSDRGEPHFEQLLINLLSQPKLHVFISS